MSGPSVPKSPPTWSCRSSGRLRRPTSRTYLNTGQRNQIDGALVQEVKLTDNGTLSLKVHDKLAALDKLARHLGIFDDKLTLSGQVGINNPFAGLTTDELRGLVDKGE